MNLAFGELSKEFNVEVSANSLVVICYVVERDVDEDGCKNTDLIEEEGEGNERQQMVKRGLRPGERRRTEAHMEDCEGEVTRSTMNSLHVVVIFESDGGIKKTTHNTSMLVC